ncbi:phospholipid carrier-dependent glycosyltransferase [Jiangella alba]|uniref:phospholipid carrier-dependent glycosyltransferase n=1 Tax=Jiangella alba TaxID=561176 RepID=UPI00114CA232|nr:phospholipid carrier-dependent glycosyltransferase [Jiangella alba]
MSTLPALPLDLDDLRLPIPVQPRPPRPRRVRGWFRRHGPDLAWLAPLLTLAGFVHAAGMTRSPAFTEAEGELMARVTDGADGDLAAAQLAAWTGPTGALDRATHVVGGGREALLVVLLLGVVLMWVLARRLGVARPAAAVAVVIYAVSPLALHLHRLVLAENVAVLWMLLAFVLATARRGRPVAFPAAGVAVVLAALTQATFVVVAPFVVWTMWQQVTRRRWRLALAGVAAAASAGAYGYLLASLGELGGAAPERWWTLDPVLVAIGPVAAGAALLFPPLRPAAAALITLALLIVVPGGPAPVVLPVAAVPLAALLVPATAHRLVVRLLAVRGRPEAMPLAIMSTTAAAALIVAVTATWPGELRPLLRDDPVAPVAQAERWLTANVPHDVRLVVDQTLRADLLRSGFAAAGLVPFTSFPASAGTGTGAGTERGPFVPRPPRWTHYDYVVSTAALRDDDAGRADVGSALAESTVVAVFGQGDGRVEIRAVHPLGREVAEAVAAGDRHTVRYATGQLLRNDALTFDAAARAVAAAGRVDPRLVIVLGKLSGTYELDVSLPALPGEDDGVRRRLVLAGLPTEDEAARLALWLLGQPAPFTPSQVDTDGTTVTVTYSLTAPRGLLPDPPHPEETP